MRSKMPLGDFLIIYKPAYGDNWDSSITDLLECASEKAIIDELVRQYKRDGKFKSPVQVGTVEPYADEDSDYVEPAYLAVFNGMHRVSALVGMGVQEIEYTTQSIEHDQGLSVEFEVVMPSGDFDDAYDKVACAVRSFPVEDSWAETDVIGTSNSVWSGVWYWPIEKAELLVHKLEEQVTAVGGKFTLIKCEVEDMTCE